MPNASRTRPSFDVNAINDTVQRALASAGLDLSSGPMRQMTETLWRALAPNGAPFEGVVRGANSRAARDRKVHTPSHQPPTGELEAPGSFETREFTNHAGTRAYKVYVPAQLSEGPRPVLVMLHGCTQSASDFAMGTQMNRLAEEHGFLVVYPEQAAQANASKCWNWFLQQDQVRNAGEPSLIAGIVGDVVARHGADSRRIFVAGLSAGAAMAVVLGETYPELFAGVGVHSGLPYGSAHDIPSAMAAMKGGRSGLPGLKDLPARGAKKKVAQPVPVILFHGDRDHTVQHSNGSEIVKQAVEAYLAQAGGAALASSTAVGKAPGGRSYDRTLYTNRTGQTQVEAWTLHGAGHAWSGGDARGSYTDRKGPDASAEMVRFFLELPRSGSA